MGAVPTPINRAFTNQVGYLLRNKRSEQREQASLAALERVFEAGWAFAEGQVDLAGLRPGQYIQGVAYDVDPHALSDWMASACRLYGEPDYAQYLPVSQVAMLLNAGMSAERTHAWFGSAHIGSLISVRSDEVSRAAAFLDAGWTRAQEQQLRAVADRVFGDDQDLLNEHYATGPVPSATWAALAPADALLACAAGLRAAEAVRLHRSGHWDVQTLRTLAALHPTSRG